MGRSCKSDTLTMEIRPRPPEVGGIRSLISKEGSPKNTSAFCCCNSTILRCMVPMVWGDMLPYSALISSLPSFPMYCNTFCKSFKSIRGRPRSSQNLKIIAITPSWVSLSPKIFENNTGPNSVTVARKRAPGSSLNVSSSSGNPSGVNSIPMLSQRSFILSFKVPGAPIPLKSPLISIINTFTPALLSPSARPCKVLVLPVPVAPAISPWRFMVFRGNITGTPGTACPSCIACPSKNDSPLN